MLFLTYRFPFPADRGDRLTVYHLLRALSAAGHEVTLVSFTDGREPPEAFERVSAFCARIETVHLAPLRSWLQAWAGLPLFRPSQISYYRSAGMKALIDRLLAGADYDIVFAHMIRMAPYGAAARHPLKVLWIGDSLGLALGRSLRFAPFWRRPGIAWERWRVDRFTGRVSRSFQDNWALSDDDLSDERRIGCVNQTLVRHGVDERLLGLARIPSPVPSVVFLGNLSVPHNVDAATYAAREIWPAIRAEFPQARLRLTGADPSPAVQRLARIPGVEVTGPVPDLLDLWASASVLLAPLRFSTGIQNKVLEAMAGGVPVVTTPRVAEAIGARDGEHLLAADGAGALAAAVLRTLRDPAGAQARAGRAREHVRARFSWGTAVRRLEQLVAERERGRGASPPALR